MNPQFDCPPLFSNNTNPDLPPNEVWGPNENGIKMVVSFSYNKDGQKIKQTNLIRVITTVRKISRAEAKRKKSWKKFGKAASKNEGCTLQSSEDIKMMHPDEYDGDNTSAIVSSLLKTKKGSGLKRLLERQKSDGEKKKIWVPHHKQTNQELPNTSIRISNLPAEIDKESLSILCKPFGRVTRIYIPVNYYTKIPKGFAFISFFSHESANKALTLLNDHRYAHLILKTDWAAKK